MPERYTKILFGIEKTRIGEVLVVMAGASLYAASMPGKIGGIWWFSYIALVPLFFCLNEKNSPFECALLGLLYGSIFSFIFLYWVEFTLSEYGGLGTVIGYLAALLLSIYSGIFVSSFFWILACAWRRLGEWALLGAPFLWCGIELVRVYWGLGFPWMLLGYSQYQDVYARLFASFGGVFGTGFMVMACNVFLYVSLKRLFEGKIRRGVGYTLLGIFALALLHLPGIISSYAGGRGREGTPFRVAVIQPNIDQWKKWEEDYQEETLAILNGLTGEGLKDGADMIVWPETALPFFYYWEEDLTKDVEKLVGNYNKPLVTGVPWYVEYPEPSYFNSIILLTPGEGVKTRYDKNKLVPFGEYVPFRRVLFFIEKLTNVGEDFSAGREVSLLRWGEVKVVPSICYEAIYPQLAVSGVKSGGNLLINLTNDAWFGDSSAPYQQLYMAAFRSVETGRYMIRCSNSGVSAVIDEKGEIFQETGLFMKEWFIADARLLTGMTFYVKNANLIHLFIMSGAFILILSIFIRRS